MGEPEGSFVNAGGLKIFCRYWYPAGSVVGIVFVCHGAGEHCLWYEPLAKALNARGLFVFAHDHVGHGLSEGDRVHVDKFSTYVDDVVQHVKIVRERYPTVPAFIIGHSLGGAITLKLALDHPGVVSGVVLIGPLVETELASPFLIWFGRWFARLVPQLQVKQINPELISRNKDAVKRYVEDPLVWHGKLKAWFGLVVLDATAETYQRLPEVKFPFLTLHGTEDKLCMPSGSQKLFDQATSTDKTLKLYPGAYHQLHYEIDGVAEQVTGEICDWIVKRSEVKHMAEEPTPEF